MSMHAKWNNMLSTLFEKRTGYTHIQQARPALACIKVYNAPILCSFVWRIHHVNWQVAELLTIICQISGTTGRCTPYTVSSCAERCTAEIKQRLYYSVYRISDYIYLPTQKSKEIKQNASTNLLTAHNIILLIFMYLLTVYIWLMFRYLRICASSYRITGDAWKELLMTYVT